MAKRNYRKEYDEYHGTKEQKKRRAQRNAANAKAKREGKIQKGDGNEVDHIGANRRGSLDNSKVRVVSRRKNRRKQPKRDGSED